MATAALSGMPPEARRAARDTLGGATAAAAQLPDPMGARLLETARAAFTHAMQFTVITCAVIAVLTAVAAVLMLRRVRARAEGEPAPGTERLTACAGTEGLA